VVARTPYLAQGWEASAVLERLAAYLLESMRRETASHMEAILLPVAVKVAVTDLVKNAN